MKTLSISTRLASTMAFLGLLLAASVGFSLFGMSIIHHSLSRASQEMLPEVTALLNSQMYIMRARLVLDRMVIAGSSGDGTAQKKRAEGFLEQSDVWYRKFETTPHPELDVNAIRLASEERDRVKGLIQDTVAKQSAGNQAEATQIVLVSLPPQFNKMVEAINTLHESQQKLADGMMQEADQRYTQMLTGGALMLLAGLACAFTGWLLLRRAIIGPLQDVLGGMQRIGAGDLVTPVPAGRADEMGSLLAGLSQMQASLSGTVVQVRIASDAIATASNEILSGNTDLSSRTEQQAASLEETASSMAELTSTVRQNSENAGQASALADNALGVARDGAQVVGQVVDTMAGIAQSSGRIAEIIGMIESIAFQTNILALNAAVEAARAGEQGRGFAVVASEVRSLAQRSSVAAKDIRELIGTSSERVGSGTRLVAQAGDTMEKLRQSVQRVSDIMGEIASASVEQSRGIEEVNRAVLQMDQVTQQNAALVEEAAAAAGSLQDQAAQLRQTMSVFNADGSTQPASRLPATAAVSVPVPPMRREPVLKPVAALRPASANTPATPIAHALPRPARTPELAPRKAVANGEWDSF